MQPAGKFCAIPQEIANCLHLPANNFTLRDDAMRPAQEPSHLRIAIERLLEQIDMPSSAGQAVPGTTVQGNHRDVWQPQASWKASWSQLCHLFERRPGQQLHAVACCIAHEWNRGSLIHDSDNQVTDAMGIGVNNFDKSA